MYTHPSFMRGRPDLLSQLRKLTSSPRRRPSKISPKNSIDESDTSCSDSSMDRSVSPPMALPSNCFQPVVQSSRIQQLPRQSQYMNQAWLTFSKHPSYPQETKTQPVSLLPSPKKDGRGRLDLLALVIERESCLAWKVSVNYKNVPFSIKQEQY